MKWLTLTLALLAFSPVARAEEPPPRLTYPLYWRVLLGGGQVPHVDGADLDLTVDFGSHTFGGAFSTGISTSFATALDGRMFVLAGGLFVQIDLVYVAVTRFWMKPPPRCVPFHLQLGWRIGIGLTESFPNLNETPWASPYMLIRPEMRSFLDLEFPFGPGHRQAFVVRGAVDTPVNLATGFDNIFRWSASVGLRWGWGQ